MACVGDRYLAIGQNERGKRGRKSTTFGTAD
jgi:hypothetical protein